MLTDDERTTARRPENTLPLPFIIGYGGIKYIAMWDGRDKMAFCNNKRVLSLFLCG